MLGHREIDPLFGALVDFKAMLAEVHRLGLRDILDQVVNHISVKHSLSQESRKSRDYAKADWFVWAAPRLGGTPSAISTEELGQTQTDLGSSLLARGQGTRRLPNAHRL